MAVLGLALLGVAACSGPRVTRVRLAEPDREDRWVERFGEEEVVVYADPSLEPEIRELFAALRAREDQGVPIVDGFSIQYGWTTLRAVRNASGELVMREPDYDAVDPEQVTRADVSVSLRLDADQRSLAQRALVDPQPVNFDEQVMVAAGALEQQRVYLLRVPSPSGRMTGWRVAGTEVELPDAEAEYLPVHALLKRRPGLLVAMQLPDGYMAFFDGDELEVIVDRNDQPVWVRPGLSEADPDQDPDPDPDPDPDQDPDRDPGSDSTEDPAGAPSEGGLRAPPPRWLRGIRARVGPAADRAPLRYKTGS